MGTAGSGRDRGSGLRAEYRSRRPRRRRRVSSVNRDVADLVNRALRDTADVLADSAERFASAYEARREEEEDRGQGSRRRAEFRARSGRSAAEVHVESESSSPKEGETTSRLEYESGTEPPGSA